LHTSNITCQILTDSPVLLTESLCETLLDKIGVLKN